MPVRLPIILSPVAVPAGTVYLVRHGLVHNPAGMMYGWLPRFRLAEEGRRQAGAAADLLVDKEIAGILTSPLLRAIETTRIISTRLSEVPVKRSRLLIEGGLARYWQGNYWARLPEEHPEEYRQWQEAAGSIEHGESLAAMSRRMRAAVARALRWTRGRPAVCVSHRDPIAALRMAIEGRPFDDLHKVKCVPASITIVRSNAGHLSVVDYLEPPAARTVSGY